MPKIHEVLFFTIRFRFFFVLHNINLHIGDVCALFFFVAKVTNAHQNVFHRRKEREGERIVYKGALEKKKRATKKYDNQKIARIYRFYLQMRV
jgi:hypothetical protein